MTAADAPRFVVIGLGVQGRKRQQIAGDDVVATVDPVNSDADHRDLDGVPVDAYDAAFVCTPDGAKIELLRRLLRDGKHVLVEKPFVGRDDELDELGALADEAGVACYTAYNHRFEPHLVRLRAALANGDIGDLYRLRVFYGNGTAADVRASAWRDQGSGVLADLGSHILDLLLFLTGTIPDDLDVWSAHRFENRAPDHVVCGARDGHLTVMEMSLVSWRNDFLAEAVGSTGSITVSSLCKWGPSTFVERRRILPSGRPTEDSSVLVMPDPTWQAEHEHFVALCSGIEPRPSRAADRAIGAYLRRLAEVVTS